MTAHPGAAATTSRPGFVRRHRGLVFSVLTLGLVTALAAGAFAYVLNQSLDDIERVPLTIAERNRPIPAENDSLNILLLGVDSGSARAPGENSILQDAASGRWPRGKYRSDATMLVHIDADRESAYIASIPRDSYLPMFDGTGAPKPNNKVNAALSLYGPSGAVSTVENFTGLRVDHLAMVDWDGFEEITNALGGVKIITAEEGKRTLNGNQALEYVRNRFTVEGGDFGRIRRQQNFLRSLMTEILNQGILTNPVQLRNTVSSVAKSLAVDKGWSNGSIRSLAFSMRGLASDDVTFMTIPTLGIGYDSKAGSIVNVDDTLSGRLFDAMRLDAVGQFVADYPELVLGSPSNVD